MTYQCIVMGCENNSDAGTMLGPLCTSCHHMLRSASPRRGNDWVSKLARKNTELRDALRDVDSVIGKALALAP